MELISREEVRKCFNGTITTSESNIDSIKEYLQKVCTKIEELPTIESRPKGKWVQVEMERRTLPMYQCSACNHNNLTKSNYCPDCGAEMEGEE